MHTTIGKSSLRDTYLTKIRWSTLASVGVAILLATGAFPGELAHGQLGQPVTEDVTAGEMVITNQRAEYSVDSVASETTANIRAGGLMIRLLDPNGDLETAQGVEDRMRLLEAHGHAAAERLSAHTGVALAFDRIASNDMLVYSFLEARELSAAQAERAASELRRNASVLDAEPAYIRIVSLVRERSVPSGKRNSPGALPDDPYFPQQWNLGKPDVSTWGIDASGAWDALASATAAEHAGIAASDSKGSAIVVAIVDTGIVASHPDLARRIVGGYDFVAKMPYSRDGDGRDANPADPGDYVAAGECYEGSDAADSTWHGTHVAGIVASESGNSEGIAGVAGAQANIRLLNVRALGACGGLDSDLIDAVRWSAGLSVPGVPRNPNPARVINMSFGGLSACSGAWQRAIDEVRAQGVVLVAGAGNDAVLASRFSPSSCRGVIAVTASTRDGARAFYANYGPGVTLAAPGGGGSSSRDFSNRIMSTFNTGLTVPDAHSYKGLLGTSMAAPHVAGVVGLMLSARPDLQPVQVQALLTASAQKLPSNKTCATICGSGLVNAPGAVRAALDAPKIAPVAFLPLAGKARVISASAQWSTTNTCGGSGPQRIASPAEIAYGSNTLSVHFGIDNAQAGQRVRLDFWIDGVFRPELTQRATAPALESDDAVLLVAVPIYYARGNERCSEPLLRGAYQVRLHVNDALIQTAYATVR
jgi:serine protease